MKLEARFARFLDVERYRARALTHFRELQRKRKLVVIGSAHKVGSTWLYDLIKNMCGLRPLVLPDDLLARYPNQSSTEVALDVVLENIQIPFGYYILKSHSLPPSPYLMTENVSVQFLTVVRDPRDVVVSASFYLANLPVDQGGWGSEFCDLSEKERLLEVIENGGFLSTRLREWFACPFAYKVRYEDLLEHGVREIKNVLDYLGFDCSTDLIRRYHEKWSFKKMSGRAPGMEDKKSFYRKGVRGDWKNYFDNACIQAYKTARNGEWQDLLVQLGYESNEGW